MSTSIVTGLGAAHFLINLLCILFYRRSFISRNAKETRYVREDSTFVPMHILIDGISGVAVLASSWLAHSPNWTWIDCAGAAVTIIMVAVNDAWPMTWETGRLLLQTTPSTLRDALDRCVREASTVEGVLECVHEHFWTQSPGVFVGSLQVRVRSDANEQLVLAKVTNIFSHLISHLTVQIVKDDWQIKPAGVGV